MNAPSQDRAHEIIQRRDRSRTWMASVLYDQAEVVFKSYLCERDADEDDNGHGGTFPATGSPAIYDAYGRPTNGQKTTARTSIGMPDTWSVVRRQVARYTAQPPNLRFRGSDQDRASRVSRKIMRDWDRGGVQRQQKKHVAQAALFGWSVRAWYWDKNQYRRKKRVEALDPNNLPLIWEEYGAEILTIGQRLGYPTEELPVDGPVPPEIIAELMALHSRAGLLPVSYMYNGYEGARCEFLLVSDCFPEPNFTSIQTSNWFIVERKRNRKWLEDLDKAYGDDYPELRDGLNKLFTDYPKGTKNTGASGSDKNLRSRLERAIDRAADDKSPETETNPVPEWTILECHTPGSEPKLALVAEEGVWLGEIDYPYELEGKVGFTECVLIDSLLGGIGDSTARVMRGLQLLHDRQVNVRFDLAYNILRPLVYCTDRTIIENPDMVKRHSGMRLVHVPTANSIGVIGEQAAMSAIATGFQDEGAIERQIQKLSGESNMSMQANVDPAQNRTATGARIMAYIGDILSKDGIDMFTETCLKPDAEMIYLLNRSELSEAQQFDAAPYYRSFDSNQPVPKSEPIEVSPLDFQDDGEIEPEVGSTLADDDESKVTKAQALWSAFAGNPTVNQEKLRDRLLVALGEGRNLSEWAAPPPQPPAPPEIRGSVSFAPKWEILSPPERQAILEAVLGGKIPAQLAVPPEAMGGAPPAPEIPEAPPEEIPIAAGAAAAAAGQSPLEGAAAT